MEIRGVEKVFSPILFRKLLAGNLTPGHVFKRREGERMKKK